MVQGALKAVRPEARTHPRGKLDVVLLVLLIVLAGGLGVIWFWVWLERQHRDQN
jgi:hypothetical protein